MLFLLYYYNNKATDKQDKYIESSECRHVRVHHKPAPLLAEVNAAPYRPLVKSHVSRTLCRPRERSLWDLEKGLAVLSFLTYALKNEGAVLG